MPDSVLFFDGVCNLCNGFIDFLISRSKNIKFAPLQGETAKKHLPEFTHNLHTVVLQQNNRIFIKSSAALRAIASCGRGWKLVLIFLLVPPFIRNFIYDLVANNRYKLFGVRNSCRLPTPQERAKFLD